MIETAEILLERVVGQVPRILGLADRREGSRAYGCFDRYYWHYKLHDWKNARFQEAAYLLALLWATPHEKNPFAGKDAVRDWAKAAMEFWSRSRHRDGSVDELYPHERSFCATAFSACACLHAARILGTEPPDMASTLRFLKRFDNPDVANQRAAAALALVLGGEYEAAAKKISALVESQDAEGFFPEYGGGDIGYQSITLGLLTELEKSLPETPENVIFDRRGLAESIARGIAAVSGVIDEKGRYDNRDSSRQTQYLYLHSFAGRNEDVIEKVIAGLREDAVLQPGWMDDRYVIPFCADYLLTYRALAGLDKT